MKALLAAEYKDGQLLNSPYEQVEAGGIGISKAEVIDSARCGIGKPEDLEIIKKFAKALGAEHGASRPVVDTEWSEYKRQVGTTGPTISPKLSFVCGISDAIQHLAGMKKSDFIIAVNTDKNDPIAELADVLIVADLKQFVPVSTEKLSSL